MILEERALGLRDGARVFITGNVRAGYDYRDLLGFTISYTGTDPMAFRLAEGRRASPRAPQPRARADERLTGAASGQGLWISALRLARHLAWFRPRPVAMHVEVSHRDPEEKRQ